MAITAKQYQQFLVNSPKYFTCDYIAQYLNTSGDTVERFLKDKKLKPKLIWETQKDDIILSNQGCLIIDKTVLEHRNSKKIELAYVQHSGQSHTNRMGIGLINLVYYNPELDMYWLIDYRIWDKPESGKTEIDHTFDLVKGAVTRNITFEKVLFDGFYASRPFLNFIALDLGKVFYTNAKSNALCSVVDNGNDTIEQSSSNKGQVRVINKTVSAKVSSKNLQPKKLQPKKLQPKKLQRIDELQWTEEELWQGKNIRLNKSPKRLIVKLFQIVVQPGKIENLITNDLDHSSMDAEAILKEYSARWKIELVHREVKQTLGISLCQCRKQRSQRNHIASSLLAYVKLKKLSRDKQITIYRLKRIQLDEYMKWITKNPIFEIE